MSVSCPALLRYEGLYCSAGKCQLHGVDNVGTVPAAVTAYLAVHEFKPDLVISVGTAGGFKAKGAAIGDVFMATAFANHDRRIPIPVSCCFLLLCFFIIKACMPGVQASEPARLERLVPREAGLQR